MMSVSFSALNAKVRYWMSDILTAEKVQNLLSMNLQDSSREIMKHEKKADWSGEETEAIESGLLQAIPEYIKSAARFLSGAERDFLIYWMRSFEIENLKSIGRFLVSGKPIRFLYATDSKWLPSKEEISAWHDFESFKEALKGTDYYELAEESFTRVEEEHNSFYWEIGLDNLFAQELKKMSEKLSSASRKEVKSLLFYALELSRLDWMKRLRFSYKMSVEELRSFVPNVLGILSERRYHSLLEAEDEQHRLKLLESWRILPVDQSGQRLETRMNFAIRKKSRSVLRVKVFSFGVLWAFLLLKAQDIRVLTVILEGKRQGLSPSVINSILGPLE